MKLLRYTLFTLLVLSLAAVTVWAEDDPPGRVARLQYMDGSVSVQPRGTDDWVEGSLNRPLTSADNIWADKSSRAELNVGTGVLRINAETSLTLTNISDNTVQVQLHQGTLNLHVRKLYSGEIYEVDTPNQAFTVQKSGDYRFDVGADGDSTLVTVWKGEGHATGDGPSVRVRAHEQARFSNGTSLTHEISAAPNYDGFDDWARVRNEREDKSISGRYVSPDVIGSEDLDAYGTWRTVPEYGPIWVPTSVGPGWAPYHYGHWVWISPWGWTWVDDAPWGFAPFHYGRWVYYNNYWGWAPGPYYGRFYRRPIYAPALVAWFGGPRWGVSIGFGGGYGWCPLGFGEPFIPWYRGSRNYFRNVNIRNTRIVNINRVTNNFYNNNRTTNFRYANLRAPGGVTAVPQHTIQNGLPVSKSALSVSQKDLSNIRMGGKVGLEPTRNSVLGANAGRPAATPPQRSFARPVMSKKPSPAAPSRPMGTKVAELEKPDAGRTAGRMSARTPDRQPAVSSPASGRTVPRPPQREESSNHNNAATARNVPRPPSAGGAEPRTVRTLPAHAPQPSAESNRGASQPLAERSGPRATPSASSPRSMDRSMDRGTAPGASRPSGQQPSASPRAPANHDNSNRPSGDPHNVPRPSASWFHSSTPSRNVPRPTGPVIAANYQSGRSEFGRSEHSRSQNGSQRYGSISTGRTSSYSSGVSRGYSSPSPRYSAPSASRNSQRYSPGPSYHSSAPSYRSSAPSSHGSAPSSHGSAPSRGSSGSHSSGHSGR